MDKRILTKAKDRISFLYIEKARIEQTEYGIRVIRGSLVSEVPVATISCLLLGPGTSITHTAIANISASGCSVCWVGSDICSFCAYGTPLTNHSKNILIQMKCHESKSMHLDVVRKMYAIRYPDERLKTKTVEELRGVEGLHVKNCYKDNAEKYHVDWRGRCYDKNSFASQDVPNQCITALNHVLYAVVESVIVALGFSPAIGFIHTGLMRSFVYEVADLYKERCIIPLAFKLAEFGCFDRHRMLREFREIMVNERLMPTIVKDILSFFDDCGAYPSVESELLLWGDKSFGVSGKNYG